MSNNRWTMADIERKGLAVAGKPKTPEIEVIKTKYGNKKTEGFDSKHEYECYKQLELKQKAGLITALSIQVTFHLIPGVSYKADFTYFDKIKKLFIVADAKGMKTKEYIIKKKMMKELLKIEVVEM